MRGIKGHGYYTENYGEFGFFIGLHTESELAGQIKKSIIQNKVEIVFKSGKKRPIDK